MTSTDIYYPTGGQALPELPPAPINVLVVGAADLFMQAADLPKPCYLSISECGQSIGMLFGGDRTGIKAITRWALHFGAVVRSDPHHSDTRGPETLYRAEFNFYGITVEAYAFIPA